MGDRANIGIRYGGNKIVYFYGHWAGSYYIQSLAKSLDRSRSRWGDASYLARIIFCDFVGDNVDGLTGFGIAPYIVDNEYPIMVVDPSRKCVDEYKSRSNPEIDDKDASYSFEAFIEAVADKAI